MAFCKNCGAEVQDGAKFCMNCGAPMEEAPAETVEAVVENTSETVSAQVITSKAPEAENVNGTENNAGYSAPNNGNTAGSTASYAATAEPGKGKAIASLVLGLVGVVFWFFGLGSIVSLVCGIVGIVLSGKSKKEGYTGGMRTAGFILSLIALIGGAIFLIVAISCAGAVGCAACAAASSLGY